MGTSPIRGEISIFPYRAIFFVTRPKEQHLKTETSSQKRFTQEQRQRLAILHDDIDVWTLPLKEKYKNSTLFEFSTGSETLDENYLNRQKKRTIYGIPEREISEMLQRKEYYLAQMVSITKGITVRSITNKLPNIHQDAKRIAVTSANSFKQSSILISTVKMQLDTLMELDNPSREDIEKKDTLDGIYRWAKANSRDSVEVWWRSDRVTYSAYDKEEHIIVRSGFFKGGVFVPPWCNVREPIYRKPRSDKNGTLVELNKNYFFALR